MADSEGILDQCTSNYEDMDSSIRRNGKRPASMLTDSIQSASKRRRVETTAIVLWNPQFAAAQTEHLRMTNKSPSVVSFEISLRAGAPDVEMEDVAVPPGSSFNAGHTVVSANIAGLDLELRVPSQYIREGHENTGLAA